MDTEKSMKQGCCCCCYHYYIRILVKDQNCSLLIITPNPFTVDYEQWAGNTEEHRRILSAKNMWGVYVCVGGILESTLQVGNYRIEMELIPGLALCGPVIFSNSESGPLSQLCIGIIALRLLDQQSYTGYSGNTQVGLGVTKTVVCLAMSLEKPL